MNKKCCVVIITHKERLGGDEELSLKRMIKVFGDKRPITAVIPDNVSDEYYKQYDKLSICKVNSKWLSNYREYNAMCCNKEFYELFKDYDYILIYQTDCWVFEDRLDYFMELGYDYYGAPWVHNNDKIGNGGLSLRKVSKMIDITSKYQFNGESLEGAEDTWFSITHGEEINTCPLDVAVNFSIENPARKYLEKVNKLPMGFHGKTAMSLFWDNDGTKFINYSNRILNKKKVEKPMRILFDNQVFDLQRFGGISRMYADIKNELNKTDEFDVSISIEKTDNEYLKDSYPSGNTNNFKISKEQIKKGDFDILYPTYFYTDFLKHIDNKPFVMSVHDMIPEIYDKYFSRNDIQIIGKKEMVKHASAIEVPTECTKKDLIRILGVDDKKIHVVGRALNPNFGTKYYSKNVLGFDYILYVGGRDYYKRFDWFIKHITPFLEKHKDIQLVCTGKKFNQQEKELINQYGLWGRVKTLFADDIIMATLYKYAKFFVFSSEYEGFGLPVLESYKMGCVALLNDIEVFREITDNKGTFFTLKENESNLSEVAENVLSLNDEERKGILDTQYKILEKYNFEKYINNFKTIFRNVAKENGIATLIEQPKPIEKISIITVNFNNNVGLKKTIESVINQTVFNDKIEYIIIDGGSTDGSVEVINQYKDKLHYYVSEKDNGIYDAMNKGINVANGDYCLFLNSGDYLYENDVIEKMMPHLIEDVVYGDLMINEKSKKIYKSNIDIAYFNYESLPHPSSFIKAELLKDNLYKTDYKIISDWIFFRECVAKGKKFKHVDITVSNFYLGGVSSNANNILKEKGRYFNAEENDYEICVVIPCYNQGKYIKETIDSLKVQIYEDFHCVIVNDGSTDNSEEVIVDNIKDDNRFEYYKIENHGQSYARNFGISKTNSRYILCLDSDDKISTAYIECAVRYLNKHPETSLFYGNALLFYEGGKMSFWKLADFSYRQMFTMNCIYSSCVYRRKDYNKCGGYDESMKGYEDWDFLIRLLYKNDNVYKTNDIVFYYRRHDDSIDATVKKDIKAYKKYIIAKNNAIFKDVFKNEIEDAKIKKEQAT